MEASISAGVAFERYAGVDQDAAGVWTAPGGAGSRGSAIPTATSLSLAQQPSERWPRALTARRRHDAPALAAAAGAQRRIAPATGVAGRTTKDRAA